MRKNARTLELHPLKQNIVEITTMPQAIIGTALHYS